MLDSSSSRRRRLAVVTFFTALAACSDGGPAGPGEESFGSLTVDASTDWAFVELGTTATPRQVSNPGTSAGWDIAFFASRVMLNGGAAGPGQVEGVCLCQNEGATDAQIIAMSPASELADFEAVSAQQIPADGWESDALDPAIDGWYSYNPISHQVSVTPDRAWKLRTAEGTAFAKLRVTGLVGATMQHAGTVTLEFATQPAAGQPLGPVRTLAVDVSAGPVYVDLLNGGVSDASDWDLRLEGWDIRVNSGVSGSGQAGAIDAGEPFTNIVDAGDVPATVYRSDAFGGIFDAKPWYRYNLQGNHQIWPTYDVYLVRSGADVYKVQLTGYYESTTGAPRHITFRYAKLEN